MYIWISKSVKGDGDKMFMEHTNTDADECYNLMWLKLVLEVL